MAELSPAALGTPSWEAEDSTERSSSDTTGGWRRLTLSRGAAPGSSDSAGNTVGDTRAEGCAAATRHRLSASSPPRTMPGDRPRATEPHKTPSALEVLGIWGAQGQGLLGRRVVGPRHRSGGAGAPGSRVRAWGRTRSRAQRRDTGREAGVGGDSQAQTPSERQ